jgi:cholesterol transport system auxiliary component
MLSATCRIAAGLAVGVPILFAGCVSSLLETESVATFPLRSATSSSPETEPSSGAGKHVAVAVERPIASGAVASDRIVVEVGDQVQFVSGARWEDDLPTLLAADIARVLQDANAIDVVDAAQRAGRADFALITVIDRMQVQLQNDYTGQAVAEIGARLVKLPDREIVATSTFRGEAAAANDAPETLAQAISVATQNAVRELVTWVAAQTG